MNDDALLVDNPVESVAADEIEYDRPYPNGSADDHDVPSPDRPPATFLSSEFVITTVVRIPFATVTTTGSSTDTPVAASEMLLLITARLSGAITLGLVDVDGTAADDARAPGAGDGGNVAGIELESPGVACCVGVKLAETTTELSGADCAAGVLVQDASTIAATVTITAVCNERVLNFIRSPSISL